MRPSSPLSLLLFIRLISATPVPDLSSDCQTLGTCRYDATESVKPRISLPDETLPAVRASAFIDERNTLARAPPVEEPVSAREIDSAPKTISSSDASYVETVVFPAAHYPSSDGKTASQQEPQADDSELAPSRKKVSWTSRSREDSELLVVGIVVLFVVALVAWETVGTLDRLRTAFCRYRRQRGPIFLSDDEERATTADRSSTVSNRGLPKERLSSEKKPHRWGAKPSCCSDDKTTPCTCGERTDLSTTALISKCVRGVCEL